MKKTYNTMRQSHQGVKNISSDTTISSDSKKSHRIFQHFSTFLCSSLVAVFLLTACAPQAYLTIHSEPFGAHLYTKSEKYIGVTPYTVKLDDIPQEAQQKGVWEIGELVAFKEGYEPIRRTLKLDIAQDIKTKKKFLAPHVTEWEFLFDFNSESDEHNARQRPMRNFFACNYWLDEDQNNCISRSEFQGVKEHFRSHEKITFVALLKQDAGVNYSYVLEAPDGSVYRKTSDNRTRFENAMAQAEFYVRDLVSTKGVGQWKMQWMIEGNPVAITAVNLTR